MSKKTCDAVSDSGVRCKKPPHGEDENHWGLKPDGMDVVWASVTLRPPKRPTPLIPGTPGPVAAGEQRRFLSTLQGEDGEGIPVRMYTNQQVTVVELRAEPDPNEDISERMWTVRADDGVTFAAWESELIEGGSNVYVTPEGEYEDNPEWRA